MSAEGAGASSHSVEVSPSEDEQSGSELRADENDDDNNDPNDGSDTSRVVESATSYARFVFGLERVVIQDPYCSIRLGVGSV
jgi:hypothetical protein